MKEGRPSLTAVYVSFARAVSTYERELSRACQDPAAEQLLPAPLARVIARCRRGELGQTTLFALRQSSFGMFDHLALRTRIIDDAVSQATLSGVRQLVLLGAGLDARAHRLEQLDDTVVYEVDHPSTQALKRAKAAQAPVLAKQIRYAPCDFERVHLSEALARAQFDPSQPSVWVWEGVTMYLPMAALVQTLDTLSRLTTRGSRLVSTYLEPKVATHGKLLAVAGMSLLGALAEPVRSQIRRQQWSELLRSHGFYATSDLRPLDLAERFGIERVRPTLAAPAERVSVADKQTSA